MKTSAFRNVGLLFSLKTALFGLLILTASCKKDTEVVTPDGGGGSSLACVGKNLRLTALNFDPAMDIDGDGKVDSDLLKFMPACALDNTINFEKGGKLSGSEGPNVCPGDDESPVDVEASTWTYDAGTKVLRIVPTGKPSEATDWKVQSVSSNMIKAAIQTESEDGGKLNLVMTWQAQ